MNIIKAGCAGLIGSVFIFVVVFIGVHVTGMAPFNMSPAAAFLAAIGLPPMPFGIVLHFCYGFAWAVIAYLVLGPRIGVFSAMVVAFFQWLVMMIIYSPIMQWGLFGFGGAGHRLALNAPLHIGNPIKYVVLTLVLHMIYGAINGALIPRWTTPRQPARR